MPHLHNSPLYLLLYIKYIIKFMFMFLFILIYLSTYLHAVLLPWTEFTFYKGCLFHFFLYPQNDHEPGALWLINVFWKKKSRSAKNVCNRENLQNTLLTNLGPGTGASVLPVERGSVFGPGPHGWLAVSTYPPGSWLGPAGDCEELGFQTSSGDPGGLGRAPALGSWWDPCARAELE